MLTQTDVKQILINYAKWYEGATQPEDSMNSEEDIKQNVETYLHLHDPLTQESIIEN